MKHQAIVNLSAPLYIANKIPITELDKDLQNLYARWIAMCKKIKNVNIPS